MFAHYDSYDYPSYWEGREYEHKAELICIDTLLRKIKKMKVIAEYGAGFGRLIPSYFYRADKIIISDPSKKLLRMATLRYPAKKISFIQSRIENIDKKIKSQSVDLVLVVRVLHHIEDIDRALTAITNTLKPGGYLIVEFANKKHLKEIIRQVMKGNITYPIDIFSRDIRSKKNIKRKTIAFINYHPDFIRHKLNQYGFSVLEKRSVSNIRLSFFKKNFTLDTLIALEKIAQDFLSFFSLGPSIFYLAKKKI